jgi:single-strand DNA-binding protein
MNKSFLSGRLTTNVKMKNTPNGKTAGTFTIVITKRRNKNDPLFMPIVAWDVLGQICLKYLKKGSKVLVVGEINTRNYDDTEGIKRWVTEIIADSVEFMDIKPKNNERVIERDEPHVPLLGIEKEENEGQQLN